MDEAYTAAFVPGRAQFNSVYRKLRGYRPPPPLNGECTRQEDFFLDQCMDCQVFFENFQLRQQDPIRRFIRRRWRIALHRQPDFFQVFLRILVMNQESTQGVRNRVSLERRLPILHPLQVKDIWQQLFLFYLDMIRKMLLVRGIKVTKDNKQWMSFRVSAKKQVNTLLNLQQFPLQIVIMRLSNVIHHGVQAKALKRPPLKRLMILENFQQGKNKIRIYAQSGKFFKGIQEFMHTAHLVANQHLLQLIVGGGGHRSHAYFIQNRKYGRIPDYRI